MVAQQALNGLKDIKLEDCTDSKKDGDKTKKDGDKAKKDEKKEKPFDKALLDPRVLTIDSVQGQESSMVIMDGSFQYRDSMGMHTTIPPIVCDLTDMHRLHDRPRPL